MDVLSRRLRLSFLNVAAAEEALPRVVDIMAEELSWSKAEKQRQTDMAINFLKVGEVDCQEERAFEFNHCNGHKCLKRIRALWGEKELK